MARMRRLVALGCCALYLAFGATADLAHVHQSADHHEESRGVHRDHRHLSAPVDHHHHGHHEHGDVEQGELPIGARHAAHHEGDVVYLTATAVRSQQSIARTMPAIVSTGTAIEPSLPVTSREGVPATQPRDPPRKIPPRLRAPPA
jgi:hypothetical protein